MSDAMTAHIETNAFCQPMHANVTSQGGFYRLGACRAASSRFFESHFTSAGRVADAGPQISGGPAKKLSHLPLRAKRKGGRVMYESADDNHLMARIARADETAMETLFTRHQGRVFGFIHRILRNDALAEELTNEVFMEVWRGARNYQGRSSATTWVLSIAHYRSLNVLRKKREQNWDEDDAIQIADERDDPEVAAQKADKGAILHKCSNALSPMHREIIDLVYFHEMSIKEASEVLDVPEGTVKTRLFKARKRLEELLDEAGVDRGWP